ncbi:MAG: hypothetical protein K8953_13305, partial [Proteobacteria bacterium]|nr:hypothetical protein [Pseudomonadota bacterium]
MLLELGNAGAIPARDEPAVKDGLFVKLDGLTNWLYIGGQEKSLGADCIESGTPNYTALIGQSVNQEIIWPPDQFLSNPPKRKILHIATPACFLSRRAHEAMMNAAERGDGAWRSEVTIKDGKLDTSTIEQILGEQSQSNKKILETYTDKPMPFAILCCGRGGFRSALGMLQSEEIGFIRCNDGMADIAAQKTTANDVLNGAPCFIEGLVAVVLTESGLLEDVVKAVPNLGVSAAVIGLLRDIAGNFETSSGSVGSAALVEGKLQVHEIDKKNQIAIKDRFLAAADLLDKLPERARAKTYPKSDKNLDNLLPNYFVDALRYAQEKKTHILTDDFLLVHAYEKIEEIPMPRHFSSLSLIKAMADNGRIDLQRYYQYFAL